MYLWHALDAVLPGRGELPGQLRRTIFGYQSLHGEKDRVSEAGLGSDACPSGYFLSPKVTLLEVT